jgi:hypothetical protein
VKADDVIESIDAKPAGKSVEEVPPAFKDVTRALIEPQNSLDRALIGP